MASPVPCPPAPPSTPRGMTLPVDVQDTPFRPLPRVDEIDELVLSGQMSFGDDDEPTEDVDGAIAVGAIRSPMQYYNALEAQASPSRPPAAMRFSVNTAAAAARAGGRAASLPAADGVGGANGPVPPRPVSSTIRYPKPIYGVLRPEGVNQVLAYHALGTYPNTAGPPPTVEDALPLPPRAGVATPSTPGHAFAGMSINGHQGLSTAENSPGLHLLADTADARYDADTEMHYEDDEVSPLRLGSPVNLNSLNDVYDQDQLVPGYNMIPEEFARQQRELVGFQLAHDEARAVPAVIHMPTAQFYSRIPPCSPVIDPVLLRGYAPMEVDGAPLPREPLAHARVDGSVSSDNDLYAPPPLAVNRPDDPPGAPQVVHLYDGAEVAGPAKANGEVRYTHDIPIRNSAALSAAVRGASGNIPQVWHAPDHVQDARHLAGGNAAPPQHVLLPPVPTVTFTTLPPGGAPPIHFDDPEFLVKGLAGERIHVIYRQPQATIVLARIFNGGVPRASNVKQQSDSLASTVTAAAWGQELSLQDQPMTWLILRLTPAHAGQLIRQRVWSSSKISFLAFNRDLKFDRFIGRVGYYTHNTDNDIDTSIRRAFAGPLILPSIRSLVAEHPNIAPIDVDPTVLRVLESIRVVVLVYPNGNIVANVYCDSPTFLVESWRTWVAYIHTVPFWSDLNPTGQFLRPIRCAGCSAADHPTFLCPLAQLPGWNGPTPGAATIEGPATVVLPGAPGIGRGAMMRGSHPYRGGSSRGRRGRGRGAAF
ncbi:hypothetical protein C8T65DRAFT_701485 [Cerioporus squamosus]|nr:hypothetical protein C8T65DRAFT_701485 [Cerioporus squamosus]